MLALPIYIGGWCNGNTTDFDSVVTGSSPVPPAILQVELIKLAKNMKPIPVGTRFCNGWVIREVWGSAKSAEMGYGFRNRHYVCYNEECDIETVLESSTIKRWMASACAPAKCQKCKAMMGKIPCFFAQQRKHEITVTPNRDEMDVTIGKVYGKLTISGKSYHSNLFADHNRHVVCDCAVCGGKHFMRYDDLRDGRLPCQNRGRSAMTVPPQYL